MRAFLCIFFFITFLILIDHARLARKYQRKKKKVNMQFDSGDSFKGEMDDYSMYGSGLYMWKEGDHYEGEFLNDEINGRGSAHWKNGDFYNGYFKEGLLHGKGTYLWSDGDKYVGDWDSNMKHGTGLFEWADGSSYNGTWYYDQRHGSGHFIDQTGEFCLSLIGENVPFDYKGHFDFDQMHGNNSIITWRNSPIYKRYVGEIRNNSITGKGMLKYSKSNPNHYDYYYGFFQNAQWNGKGEIHWQDDSILIGFFEGISCKGKAKLTDRTGKLAYGKDLKYIFGLHEAYIYEGHIINQTLNGSCTIIWRKGHSFVGEINGFNKSAYGELEFFNGTVINGFFPYQSQNSDILTLRDKAGFLLGDFPILSGYLYNGPYNNETIEGNNCSIKWETGELYEGQTMKGQLHGTGILKLPEGSFYNGTWKQNLMDGQGILLKNSTDPLSEKHTKKTLLFPKFPIASSYEYVGEFNQGKLEGKGNITWFLVNATYTGQFKQNYWHGSGILKWNDSSIYQGDFSENKFEGKGHFIEKGSIKYFSIPLKEFGNYEFNGTFDQNQPTGEGIIVWENGLRYEGNLSKGFLEGYGQMNQNGSFEYNGYFAKNHFGGVGNLIHQNGINEEPNFNCSFEFSGNFCQGLPCKFGVVKWPNGNQFKGNMKDLLFEGFGEYSWNDGSSYTGNYQKNKLHGNGILNDTTGFHGFEFTDGYVYNGSFLNNYPHKYGTIIRNNGDIYEGSITNGKLHGKGLYKWKDGSQYFGDFSNNSFHGYGILKDKANHFGNFKFQEEYSFTGFFNHNQIHGRNATIKWSSGNEYIGQLVNGSFHGEGKFFWADGSWYEGSYFMNEMKKGELYDTYGSFGHFGKGGYLYSGKFKNGIPSGFGFFQWNDKMTYEGQVENGKLNGEGTLTLKDGTYYIGMFENNMLEGIGILLDKNNSMGNYFNKVYYTYTGNFSGNYKDGNGFLSFKDGSTFNGSFYKNYPQGFGIFQDKTGNSMKGCFEDGEFIYKGTFNKAQFEDNEGNILWKSGSSYTGAFHHGKIHGKGMFNYSWKDISNRRNYAGFFVECAKNGYGILTWRDFDKYEGHWKDDWKHGLGTYYWSSGARFEGSYVFGKKEGKGILFKADGSRIEGYYKDDKCVGKGLFIDYDGITHKQIDCINGKFATI